MGCRKGYTLYDRRLLDPVISDKMEDLKVCATHRKCPHKCMLCDNECMRCDIGFSLNPSGECIPDEEKLLHLQAVPQSVKFVEPTTIPLDRDAFSAPIYGVSFPVKSDLYHQQEPEKQDIVQKGIVWGGIGIGLLTVFLLLCWFVVKCKNPYP
jgi:hypothetical protein